ncbi:hypothetical protein PM082_014222 [Marasmius tenuissimus]|nr:hypothetical protein PM082_014222 [Marasmius tenuissimus]
MSEINEELIKAYGEATLYVDVRRRARPGVYCDQIDTLTGVEGKDVNTPPPAMMAYVFGSVTSALVSHILSSNKPSNQLYYYSPTDAPLDASWVQKFVVQGICPAMSISSGEAALLAAAIDSAHAWATLYIQTH